MKDNKSENKLDPKSLYPNLTPEQQQEAAYYFGRYIDLVRRIFDRNYGRLKNLTDSSKRP